MMRVNPPQKPAQGFILTIIVLLMMLGLLFAVGLGIYALSRENKVEEHMEGYVEPGGAYMPTWLINYAQRRLPYANMLGRQRVIAKCAASDSPIPFKYKE